MSHTPEEYLLALRNFVFIVVFLVVPVGAWIWKKVR